MSEHHGSIVVDAPIHQVYTFFTHFNDFPKFMGFVKEVTYYDNERSHWVAQIAGTHEWDAVNEDWILDQQIGWRSINGLENRGRVKFTEVGNNRTQVDAYITYTPPAGLLGKAVDGLGFDSRFDHALQEDLTHFARMVEQAPPGALDPMQSHYLFHKDSALAKNNVTNQQKEAMQADPMMSPQALQEREQRIQADTLRAQEEQKAQQEAQQRLLTEQQKAFENQQELLRQKAEADRLAALNSTEKPMEKTLDPVHDTIGGRNASMDRTALGDQDGRTERFPNHLEDPMLSRAPKQPKQEGQSIEEMEVESPWRAHMYGQAADQEGNQQKTPSQQENSNTKDQI